MNASSRLHFCYRECTKLVPQLGLYKANVKSTQCSSLVRHSSVRINSFIQGDILSSKKSHFGKNLLWLRDATSLPGLSNLSTNLRSYVTDSSDKVKTQPSDAPEKTPQVKETLWQRFKKMYKEYWYVLLPVHTVTSMVWYGSFYYIAKSGIDIVPLLENVGASEVILKPLRDTGAGYFAVAYAMYKIATPARYTVTLGGTTITINYLKKWGYIKPMPSTEVVKEMIQEKRKQLRTHRAKVLAKMNLRHRGSARVKQPNQKSDKP